MPNNIANDNIDNDTIDKILRIMFKGIYASRPEIRHKLKQLAVIPEEREDELIDRIRLYQEMYRRRNQAGYKGVGLLFRSLPVADSEMAENFLVLDRALDAANL